MMGADLSLDERKRLLPFHPISIPHGYTLQTPVAKEYLKTVCEWIMMRNSGLCWTGPSDVGKTTTLRSILRPLQGLFPNHAFCWISGEQMGAGIDTQDKFMRMCLEQAGKSGKTSGSESLCKRTTNYFLQCCHDRNGRSCVLFVDEGQRLRGAHFDFLRNVWNRMDREGYELLCFLLGNDSMRDDKDHSLHTSREDNAARFFAKFSRFQGVTTEQALHNILDQYDEALHFPTPLYPYTRFFAQHAHDCGWRMGNEAVHLFRALDEVYRHRVASASFAGHTMRTITRAVHATFLDALTDPKFVPKTGQIDWEATVVRYRDLEVA